MIGDDNIDKLAGSRVCIFGVGGVGGFVCEALARSGIGSFMLVDNDTVNLTNLNRQILAVRETVGRLKVDVAKSRIISINPEAAVDIFPVFYNSENAGSVDLSGCDYIVDAVDHIPAKVEIALRGRDLGIPVISSMGAGNKLDPTRFKVADIYSTTVCPLARVMRKKLREAGIEHLKVVYSEEPPVAGVTDGIIPSIAHVPATAGLIIAGEVIRDLCLL